MAENNNPFDFMRNFFNGMNAGNSSLPGFGLVTPTLDINDLDKRIRDMKTVEGWLRTNLSMLQLTIQNLEMQRSTLSTLKTVSNLMQPSGDNQVAPGVAASAAAATDLTQMALWPWNMMQSVVQQAQHEAAAAAASPAAGDTPTSPAPEQSQG